MEVTSKSYSRGMTLLEMLVAITLMVVISTISYTSLNSLIDGKQQTDKASKEIQAEIMTSRQLNTDFESMIDRSIKSFRGEFINAMIGNSKSFSFVRNGYINPLSQFRSELQRVQWSYQNGKIIRQQTVQLETQQPPQWQQRIYLDNVRDIQIEYVSRAGLRFRNWPQNQFEALPKYVILKIELINGQEKELTLVPPSSSWL